MSNDLQVFNYNSNDVRVIDNNGEPWFVGKDVAEILGYQRTADAIKAHVDKEDKGVCDLPTPGGQQQLITINESGLYSLIISSKLPAAKKFKRWVTSEVLPSIRKYGMYLSEPVKAFIKDNPDAITNIVENYIAVSEKCKQLEQENQALQEKFREELQFAVFGRNVVAAIGSVTPQSAAQFLAQKGIPIGQNRLYRDMRNDNIICKRKGKQWNKPTQKGIENGLVNLQVDEDNNFSARTMITPKGMKYLSDKYTKLFLPVIFAIERAEENS